MEEVHALAQAKLERGVNVKQKVQEIELHDQDGYIKISHL